MLSAPTPPADVTIKLDPIALLSHASGPIKVTVMILLVASTMVWVIGVLKILQLGKLRALERGFESAALGASSAAELIDIADTHRSSPGARVVIALASRPSFSSLERLRAVADRSIVTERQRASSLTSPLGSIASAAPFIGLFGTVYGIMDAFVRIGAEKSASLPVVAPAIGEALITTAIGLAAAIPAVVFYNAIDKRIGDLVGELEASAAEWVTLAAEAQPMEPVIPLQRSPRY
ncbi:MAG: hypothetical protein NVS3B20_12100 [Polyangiales bacterium]